VWPCGETEMGHSAMLSFRIFLIMSSPVKVVRKCLSDFPVLQNFPFSPVLRRNCNSFFRAILELVSLHFVFEVIMVTSKPILLRGLLHAVSSSM